MRSSCVLLALLLACVVPPIAAAADPAPAQEAIPAEAQVANALAVAAQAYAEHLDTIADESPQARHLREIGNYRPAARREGEQIVVTFTPIPPPGVSLRGGGAEYRVEAATGKIVGFRGFR